MPFSVRLIEMPMILLALILTYLFSQRLLSQEKWPNIFLSIISAGATYFIFYVLEDVRKSVALPWYLALIEALFAVGTCAFGIPFSIWLQDKMTQNMKQVPPK